MIRKLSILLLIVFLIIPSFALADGQIAQINNQTTFYSDFYSAGILTDVDTITTTFYYQNATLLAGPFNMYHIATGVYGYNYTPTILGKFYRYTDYMYNGNPMQSAEDILIVTNINTIASDTETAFEMVFSTFILFMVGFGIVVLAKWLREPSFYLFAAVYYIGSSAYMVFTDQGWSFPMFFALFGLILMFKGIGEYLDNIKTNKERNSFDEIE